MRSEAEARGLDAWVVDNASDDGSADLVRERHPWARLIASPDNLGFGAAVNRVAERTSSDWLLIANADIALRPGALGALLEAGERDARAGAIAPRLVLPDGTTQHSVFAFPTLGFTLLYNLGLLRLSRRLGNRHCLEGVWNPERSREVPWALATFLIIRRAAWDEVGGFDPEQFIHAEDLALEWRLADRGWRVRYEPRARVKHAGSAATKKAFGDQLMTRYMAATYGWMGRTRGIGYAWAIAGMNWSGAAVRALLYRALAVVWPRFRDHATMHREWLAVHRTGFASRSALRARR
jgi:GT2 family glycosyltransferase